MTHLLSRTALVLLAASALAGCTTYNALPGGRPESLRPNFPTRLEGTASPAAAREPVATTPVRVAAPAEGRLLEPVSQAPLAPAAPSAVPEPNYSPPPVSPSPSPAYTPSPAAPSYAPPAYTPPSPPAMRTVTRATVTGKVVDAEGPPAVYTVKKGDSLYAIGRKLDISPEDLAKANGLKKPYRLQPGDKIKGPRSKAKAYVIGEGDTLFAIARRFNVSAAAIAEANDMDVSSGLKVGRKLVLPEGFRDRGPVKVETRVPVEAPAYTPPPVRPPVATPAPAPLQPAPRPPVSQPPPAPVYQAPVQATQPAPRPPVSQPPAPVQQPPVQAAPVQPAPRPTQPPVQPAPVRPTIPPAMQPAPVRPAPPVQPAPQPTPQARPSGQVIVPATPSPADLQISQLGRGRFVWPLRGDILSTFGPKGTGQRNDGLNIRAASGTTVRAAAGGDVVYAGDQVPGFGNLVLIKHADGWVTAYGHLARADVKMQQSVVQGQQIGLAGATGGVAEPQLHFEVRYAPTPADRARPIDPSLVLPK